MRHTDTVVILSSIAYNMEITTGNVPDTVVILRDQAAKLRSSHCVSDYISNENWSLKGRDT